MPKLKLGAVVYALAAIALAIESVRMIRHDGRWSEVHGFEFVALLIFAGVTASLCALGAMSRRGLIADDGPWVCRNGWIALIAVAGATFVVLVTGDADVEVWPSPAVVFLPHFVRRLQESYYEGIAEAELEIRGAGPDEGPPPAR